jgi:hypothetical protein
MTAEIITIASWMALPNILLVINVNAVVSDVSAEIIAIPWRMCTGDLK